MIKNHQLKDAKIAIQIFLTDSGDIAVKSSSNNVITNLGLIEAAKAIYIQNSQASQDEESRIQRV